MSKVLLTGRPHVEFKLNYYRGVGGLKTVEVQGLTDEQINIYVEKFSKRRDYILDINKAKGASSVPIIHVPQFLNTLCCVAILLKGQAISNSTELYCWTVYLMLKQHADKHGSSGKRVPELFSEFSKTLSAISEVCHSLLAKNKIIFEGDIKLLLGDIGKDKEFVKSLFVDVSDNITEKYQFKHLSLMEFLAAIYICKKDKRSFLEMIKDNLKKGFIEVVSFVCRLMSGYTYGGIVKEMLKNVVGLKQELNEKQLLGDIIDLLNGCGFDVLTKLSRSLEIITFFLNKTFDDKEFIKSLLTNCIGKGFSSKIDSTEDVCKFCRHLESCGWKENDIRIAFANVQFSQLFVSKVEQLDFIAVKEYFCIGHGGIYLCSMNSSMNAIRQRFTGENNNGYCGGVWIKDCEFVDELNGWELKDRQLERLSIGYCQMKNVNSFFNVCDWGMSCKWLGLNGLDISINWLERMTHRFEERQRKGDLKVKELHMYYCTSRMSHEMAMRVR